MLDPFGILIPITNRNLGLDAASIWFETFWHLDVVPLVLEVDGELTNLLMEAVAVFSELGYGDAVEDFMVVDGGGKAKGDSMDSVIEVLLGCQCCKGCLG